MKTKKFLSFALVLTMLAGMLPGMSLTASAAGNTTEITPTNTSGTMTITLKIKAAQTITADNVTATYGDTDKSVSASVTTPSTGGGTISYAVKEGSGDYISVVSDGKLTINKVPPTDGKAYVIVTAAATDDYAETTKEVTVNISTKAMTVSASDVTATADGQPHGITVNVTDPATGYTVKYGIEEGSYTLDASPTQTDVGEKTVYYQVTADNYTTYTGSAKVTVSAKQTQTITADNVTVTYGDTDKSVSATTNGNGEISYAVKDGGADYIDVDASTGALTIKKVGTATVIVTAAETATYSQATKEVTVTINKANPTYTVPTGLTATYGDTLGGVTLPTGWAWANGLQSVGNAGTNTFKANFTPSDTANYNTVSNVDVSVTVNKATPSYTVPSGLTATYGDTLSTVTLPEGWTWADGTQSVGNVGENTFKANFTPTDTNNYNTVSGVNVSVTVGKANPTYTVPTGLTATYGQTLANVTLPTGWSWVNGTASVGNVGTNSFKATFTPADTANYNTVSDVNVSVTVGKANPTYTVPTGLTATYGDTLSAVALPTGWAWADSTQSVGNVGTNTFKANFTPADTANYNTVSGVDVTVTVGKTAGKDATISTDTMTYNADSIYIEGVAGQEYVIVPKGTAVTDADWNTSVKPDPERDNWVFFENLKEATEYEIYARTAETETTFASDAVKANVYTTLSSIGYLYDSTLVGASITVEPEPDVEGLIYKWYQDVVTEDGEGAIHHNLTEIPGATGSTYTFRAEDAGKHIAVKIFSGDSEVGDFATDAPVALTAKVIFDSKGGSDVETLTDVAYQSKIKAPADPTREGFAFDGWYWDEEFETPFDFENDVFTWNETTLYAKWTPNDYKITSVTGLTGANNKQWTKGGKDAVVITVEVSGEDNSFDHFTGVKFDDVELVKDVDYTVEKGSTVVTLKPETLEKLSVGEHTVTILFDNGEVNTTLTVLAANSQGTTSPQTGDNSHLGLWIALMMLSLLGIAATFFIGKKKRVFGR